MARTSGPIRITSIPPPRKGFRGGGRGWVGVAPVRLQERPGSLTDKTVTPPIRDDRCNLKRGF